MNLTLQMNHLHAILQYVINLYCISTSAATWSFSDWTQMVCMTVRCKKFSFCSYHCLLPTLYSGNAMQATKPVCTYSLADETLQLKVARRLSIYYLTSRTYLLSIVTDQLSTDRLAGLRSIYRQVPNDSRIRQVDAVALELFAIFGPSRLICSMCS